MIIISCSLIKTKGKFSAGWSWSGLWSI